MMSRSLVAFTLLLWLLAGVEGFGACDPAGTARLVASACGSGVASRGCCEALLAPVHLGDGVPCLCRAAEHAHQLAIANLSLSTINTLVRSCTGGLRGGGIHLAAACQGQGMLSSTQPVGAGCDSEGLGYRIDRNCLDGSGALKTTCCEAIITTVDTKGCLCEVMNSSSMVWSSSLGIGGIFDLYKKCGGLRVINNHNDCHQDKTDIPISKDDLAHAANTSSKDDSAHAANASPATPESSDGDRSDKIALRDFVKRDFVIDALELSITLVGILSGAVYVLIQLFKIFRGHRMAVQQQAMETMVENSLARLLGSLQDGMNVAMHDHINVAVREAMRGMPAGGRPARSLNLIEMSAREGEIILEEDQESVNDGAAMAAAAKKKRKATQKPEGSTSCMQRE